MSSIKINFHKSDFNSNEIPIVFLHGFLGSYKNWDEIVDKLNVPWVCIDLPGHGESYFNQLSSYSFSQWNTDFKTLLDEFKISQISLCGYSMGGRLALSFAIEYPNMINKLILESISFGYKSNEKRNIRLQEDQQLANKIVKNFELFLSDWNNHLLFKNQEDRNQIQWKNQHLVRQQQNPIQISHALVQLGQGQMPFYLPKLTILQNHILLITGEEDEKYCKIAQSVEDQYPHVNWEVINNASHNTHLEQPKQFIDILSQFMN